MKKIKPYKIFESDEFLKKNFNKIFTENNNLIQLFTEFNKKVDTDTNTSALFIKFIKTDKNIFISNLNSLSEISEVNNLLLDQLKIYYFSLKQIISKIQHNEFGVETIFKNIRDKNFITLLTYDNEQFSSSVSNYLSILLDTLGETEDIEEHKTNILNWVNDTLFEPINKKIQLLNSINVDVNDVVDNMENSDNKDIKTKVINKIVNMDDNEFKNLLTFLNFKNK